MQFIYGTPDQLVEGLNFVIKGMCKGETKKIILPSHLHSVRPAVPMERYLLLPRCFYDIKILEVKLNMNKNPLLIIPAAAMLSHLAKNSKFEGYKRAENGLHYKNSTFRAIVQALLRKGMALLSNTLLKNIRTIQL